MSDYESDKERSHDIEEFIAALALEPCREAVADELGVLLSIYGHQAIALWPGSQPDDLTLRYVVLLNLSPPHDEVTVRVLVSIPQTYPASSPPQLQLLSKYIGDFGVDATLFGLVLRTFLSAKGVEWSPDCVCVFDGLQVTLERCLLWYQERLNTIKTDDIPEGNSRDANETSRSTNALAKVASPEDDQANADASGLKIIEAEPITDRKSVFVGRACRITHPAQVPLVLAQLKSDRHISRAKHPVINAWRCQVGSLLHQDNDDDGETAAGGRLAHLLRILDVSDVLVIVTRYFGGIQLGPDRFKHINQAARNALELGGFLDGGENKKNSRRGKRH